MIRVRGPTGSVHVVPERQAVLLAENMRTISHYERGDARSAADKIESRLVGADDSPIEFEEGERLEVCQTLEAVMVGWNTPDAKALFWDLRGLPHRPVPPSS